MPKREHLDQVIERVDGLIKEHRASNLPDVTISYSDLERLLNASIWGDD